MKKLVDKEWMRVPNHILLKAFSPSFFLLAFALFYCFNANRIPLSALLLSCFMFAGASFLFARDEFLDLKYFVSAVQLDEQSVLLDYIYLFGSNRKVRMRRNETRVVLSHGAKRGRWAVYFYGKMEMTLDESYGWKQSELHELFSTIEAAWPERCGNYIERPIRG